MAQQEKLKRNDVVNDMLEKSSSRISGALVMIALGVVFLLMQNNTLRLNINWWALVIFIPAAVTLYHVYIAYNRDGHITPAMRNQLSGGLTGLTIGVIAATGQWSTLWPLFMIVPGVMMLLGRRESKV